MFKDNKGATKIPTSILFAVLAVLCVVIIAIYRVEGSDGPFHKLQDLSADLLKPLSFATTAINSQVETIEENAYDASATP